MSTSWSTRQTAEQARRSGADADVVAAALLHDIGRAPGVAAADVTFDDIIMMRVRLTNSAHLEEFNTLYATWVKDPSRPGPPCASTCPVTSSSSSTRSPSSTPPTEWG
ncbi:RidA family protein [Frankia sp. BMG5.23]|uniref:RidA family protein n=1 Tax=Frankia sp. BMG5.23 TaxID=683305 RepID=UPI00046140BF|nr:RidA family protein [Frankia sp. BMG5.23]KDA42807.1 hypothetical protein BMG523Draft_02357 [Frankia sp. BMG5.23]KEZ36092.1 hypothetical protein CEDDRAFT_02564 [Frankia sp. CeD]ORT97799.1 hypothetical protein UK99_03975 [Frankia casuarinae]